MAKRNTYINSRFDSSCDECGRHINRGERILYKGRGSAACIDCKPETTEAKPAATSADVGAKWAAALGWDDSEPVAGASIGATSEPSPEPKPVNFLHAVPDPEPEPVPVGADYEPEPVKTSARIEAERVEMMQVTASENGIEPLEFTQAERAEALTCELLIILVNAVDVAGISGRHSLSAFCREQARRSLDMSSRQHVWSGIARAIDSA